MIVKIKTSVLFLTLLMCVGIVHAEYFSNIRDQIGFEFIHNNGNSQNFYYPEIVGSGVALLDFDNDGDLDIYLIQSGEFKNNKLKDMLFENQLNQEKSLSFKSKEHSFLNKSISYGIGITVGDVNNDGRQDIYLSNLKQNQLLINKDGTGFNPLKIDEKQHMWSSGASFCDINNDGYKDLYVSNYVDWSANNNPKCFNASSKQDYCGPSSFSGLKDSFYLNDKGRNFIEKTQQFFPKMPKMPGLNVVCNDINNDGFSDFIVANDGKENLVWLNQNGQSFKEAGMFSGLAVNAQGVSEASMGLAMSDYDLDGDLDVFFTHLMNESNTLYNNNGKGFFSDVTNRSKLSTQSYAYTGWAAGFLMVNNDIYPDLVVFNGAVADASQKNKDQPSLKQANQLFLNAENKVFSQIKDEKWLNEKAVSRGAAFGDIDNDGDIDIVVNNNNGPADILINNLNPEKWMGIKIIDPENRSLKVELYNEKHAMRLNTNTDGSYASAHDDRIVINQAQIEYYKGIRIISNSTILLEKPLIHNNKYTTIKIP